MALVDEVLEFLDRYGEGAVAEKISDDVILSRAGQINRKKGGGKKKVLAPCPYGCGAVLGRREMREHLPRCERKT